MKRCFYAVCHCEHRQKVCECSSGVERGNLNYHLDDDFFLPQILQIAQIFLFWMQLNRADFHRFAGMNDFFCAVCHCEHRQKVCERSSGVERGNLGYYFSAEKRKYNRDCFVVVLLLAMTNRTHSPDRSGYPAARFGQAQPDSVGARSNSGEQVPSF